MRTITLFFAILLVAGCAGDGVAPERDRSDVSANRVELVAAVPDGAERIGMIRVRGGDMGDASERHAMLRRLKLRAASRGGNVVVVEGLARGEGGASVSTGAGVDAFVPTGEERSELTGIAYRVER